MLVLVVGLKCGTPKTQYVPNVKNIVILKNPRRNTGVFYFQDRHAHAHILSGRIHTTGVSG